MSRSGWLAAAFLKIRNISQPKLGTRAPNGDLLRLCTACGTLA